MIKPLGITVMVSALAACDAAVPTGGAEPAPATVARAAAVPGQAAVDGTGSGPAPAPAAVSPMASRAASDPCLDERDPAFDPDKCGDPGAAVDRFVGTWAVTRVHVNPDGPQAFGEDDKAIVGSRFMISAAQITWADAASRGFTADDVCKQPSASAMPPIVEQEEGGALIAALKPFAIAASARAPLHRFGCIGGGSWGPGSAGGGALFIPVGTDRIVLQWYDGAVLLATRRAP